MNVTFAWPDKRLSPNARIYRMQRAKLVADYRKACAWECVAAGFGYLPNPCNCGNVLHVRIVFHPPDKRRRDLDNMLASIKPGLDGLADILGVDDSLWALTIQRAEPIKGGAVKITIKET